jgi:sigma-B regulation protein RsbU (phosphoserine phosphatase)
MDESAKRALAPDIAEAFPEIAEEHAAESAPPKDTRLYGDLREETRILALLHDVSQELTSILDTEALLAAVAARVKTLVDYDVFCVMLWNEPRQLLEHVFAVHSEKRITLTSTLGLGVGLCGTAAQTRRPVRVGNVAENPVYVRCQSGVNVRSELAVPLVVRGRLFGVLDLESTRENAFSKSDEHMLSTLAPTVAVALENARLYEQVRAAEQRMAEDLERAREMQRALLPVKLPRVHGLDIGVRYHPARELGGDFYDFLCYRDGRLGIAVGDVAGKGSAAALFGSLGVGILREHANVHPCPPAEMLEHLNERLHSTRVDGRFIALAFSVFDPHTRALDLASAGFPQPLLVRQGKAEPLEVGGVPLGLLASSEFQSLRLPLAPGDAVVFCSDGIHEQPAFGCEGKEDDDEFGFPRLRRVLEELHTRPAEEIAAGIMRAVEQHAGNEACCLDDRTIVVLKIV